jgi:hypothetical protein
MSFPPGTEMFQFPGFASTAYVFSRRSPQRRGFPIRTSADQRSLASPRGFSQRATSFIASWRQGIHRTPFSHSPSPHNPTPARSTKPRHKRHVAQQQQANAHSHNTHIQSRFTCQGTTPAKIQPSSEGSLGSDLQPSPKDLRRSARCCSCSRAAYANHRERRAEPDDLASSLKDWLQPKDIRLWRHNAILERR